MDTGRTGLCFWKSHCPFYNLFWTNTKLTRICSDIHLTSISTSISSEKDTNIVNQMAVNTRCSGNFGSMLDQPRRRWANIEPSLAERLVLARNADATIIKIHIFSNFVLLYVKCQISISDGLFGFFYKDTWRKCLTHTALKYFQFEITINVLVKGDLLPLIWYE